MREMKLLLILAVSGLATACMTTARVVNPGGLSVPEARYQPATPDMLRVAVMGFENRSRFDVGQGMAQMLESSLFQTGRFIVLEREELRDALFEQKLGATGVVDRRTAVPSGQVEGAEVLIYGTVTAFEPDQRGLMTSAGGATQAYVAIEIRLVDARSGRVISATSVEGRGTNSVVTTRAFSQDTMPSFDSFLGIDMTALSYANVSPLYSLEIWSDTPVGAVIRCCIDEAVAYVVSRLEA